MASTILRFRNPAVFQIIDRHAYRAVYARDFPKTTVAANKIKWYFDYLDETLALCDRMKQSFEIVDRVLYQFDKIKNGPLNGD